MRHGCWFRCGRVQHGCWFLVRARGVRGLLGECGLDLVEHLGADDAAALPDRRHLGEHQAPRVRLPARDALKVATFSALRG